MVDDTVSDYIHWFTVEQGPWVKTIGKNAKTGWPIERHVRFTVGKCLVCKFTKKGQFYNKIVNAMEAHADEHIARLDGMTTATMRARGEQSSVNDRDEPPPF